MNGTEILEAFKAGNLHEAEEKVFETYNRLAALVIEGTKQQIAQGYLGEAVTKEDVLDETAYDSKLDSKKKVTVTGVMGAKSKSFKKSFPNMKAFEKWSDSEEAGNYEVHHVVNEDRDSSFKSWVPYRDKAKSSSDNRKDLQNKLYGTGFPADKWKTKKAVKPVAKDLKKEDTEQIDELDRNQGGILNRYIRKVSSRRDQTGKISDKNKEGLALAGKKRWGDKTYGLPEPKVKAVERNNS